jgi:hypothetical protein
VGRLGGPLGASAAWAVFCMVRRGVFSFDACFKRGFPSCLRGPLGLSPTPVSLATMVSEPASHLLAVGSGRADNDYLFYIGY